MHPASPRDALLEQSARGSLVRGTDSLAFDYVAYDSNRSLQAQDLIFYKQKEVNRKG